MIHVAMPMIDARILTEAFVLVSAKREGGEL